MGESYQDIEFNVSGYTVEIILNRPETYNSFTVRMHDELRRAFCEAAGRTQARAIVFGARGKAFSAGGDFDSILEDQADPDRRRASMRLGRPLLTAVADCALPVICAVHGDVVGLGTTLMLCTDAVICSRNVRISDPHIAIGLAAGDGGCVLWPQAAGLLRAKRYLLTGERIGAVDALAFGLVTDLVDQPEDVLPAARALAARIAGLPPLAVQATKRILNQGLRHRIEEIFDFGLALEIETMASGDVVEAVSAFRGKRAPTYQGR